MGRRGAEGSADFSRLGRLVGGFGSVNGCREDLPGWWVVTPNRSGEWASGATTTALPSKPDESGAPFESLVRGSKVP